MKKSPLMIIIVLLISTTVNGQGKAFKSDFKLPGLDSVQFGTASFYADKFEGKKTSSGEVFRQKGMTCAHNSLPLGTWIKVTNIHNEKSVVVRVTDRMHRKNRRLVDLSKAAAKALGYTSGGLTKVKLEILGTNNEKTE